MCVRVCVSVRNESEAYISALLNSGGGWIHHWYRRFKEREHVARQAQRYSLLERKKHVFGSTGKFDLKYLVHFFVGLRENWRAFRYPKVSQTHRVTRGRAARCVRARLHRENHFS